MPEEHARYVVETRAGTTRRVFTTLRDQEGRIMYTSDRRLWLTEDKSEVVEDGDPDARYLLVAAGGEIPDDEARRYGLIGRATKEAAVHTKAVDGPAENKERAAPRLSHAKPPATAAGTTTEAGTTTRTAESKSKATESGAGSSGAGTSTKTESP